MCNLVKPLIEFEARKNTKRNCIYYSWCKVCAKVKRKQYYDSNPEKKKESSRLYRVLNPEKIKQYALKWGLNLRLEVLNAYKWDTINDKPSCRCCGEDILQFLAIDHINGGGHKHNLELKARGQRFYYWLKTNNYPKGFQILCHNCNMAKGFYGKCPHTTR